MVLLKAQGLVARAYRRRLPHRLPPGFSEGRCRARARATVRARACSILQRRARTRAAPGDPLQRTFSEKVHRGRPGTGLRADTMLKKPVFSMPSHRNMATVWQFCGGGSAHPFRLLDEQGEPMLVAARPQTCLLLTAKARGQEGEGAGMLACMILVYPTRPRRRNCGQHSTGRHVRASLSQA